MHDVNSAAFDASDIILDELADVFVYGLVPITRNVVTHLQVQREWRLSERLTATAKCEASELLLAVTECIATKILRLFERFGPQSQSLALEGVGIGHKAPCTSGLS